MNRVENQNLMKSQTFGVEIEFSGISQRVAIGIVAKHFNTENTIEPKRYDHDGTTLHGYACTGYDANGNQNEWIVVGDGSLSSSTTNRNIDGGCGELVTPVLHYGDIETLQQIVRDLREGGAVSNNSYGCGVHIHVGADIDKEGGHNPRTLRNLANLMVSHEQILIKAVNVSRSRYNGGYTCVTDSNFIRTLNRVKPSTLERFMQVWYTSQGYSVPSSACGNHYHRSRYHMLNLHSVFLNLLSGHSIKCTCEFRLFEFHGSKMHAGELKAWIQLCLAMSSYAKIVRHVSVRPVNMDNEKKSMKDWLDNMGLRGDEFKTCRKMLMKRLSGDSAYRNGRPVEDTLDDLHLVTD